MMASSQIQAMTGSLTIPQFYAGRKVFVVGATGFIGKVMIWKLLQSCALIDTIYILLRPKHGQSVQTRKNELLNSPIFDNFRKTQSTQMLEKIVVVAGDILLPELGLSDDDKSRIIDEVSVVFYGSALLKMDALLEHSIDANVLSVIRAIELAQKMKKLINFVYISTAYCCCDEPNVEEKLYPLNLNPRDVINFVYEMNLSSKAIAKITTDLIYPLPNVYIFTKRLSELVLAEYKGKLPLVITRPTIVIPSIDEPFPGWVDNPNGVTGVALSGGKGVLRTLLVDPLKKADIISVDSVCNALIAIPWKEYRNDDILSEIPIYNITWPDSLRVTWNEVFLYNFRALEKTPFELILWYPNLHMFERNKLRHQIKVILYQIVPAVLIDVILFLLRKKTFMIRVQKKILNGMKVLQYFTTHQWHFRTDNLETLWRNMTSEDKEAFPFIHQNIDYSLFCEHATMCVKTYMLKESTNNIEWCRMKMKILHALKIITTYIFYYILFKLFEKFIY